MTCWRGLTGSSLSPHFWYQKVRKIGMERILFLLIYRSAVLETTEYTPEILFGHDLRFSCDLLFGRPPHTLTLAERYSQQQNYSSICNNTCDFSLV